MRDRNAAPAGASTWPQPCRGAGRNRHARASHCATKGAATSAQAPSTPLGAPCHSSSPASNCKSAPPPYCNTRLIAKALNRRARLAHSINTCNRPAPANAKGSSAGKGSQPPACSAQASGTLMPMATSRTRKASASSAAPSSSSSAIGKACS